MFCLWVAFAHSSIMPSSKEKLFIYYRTHRPILILIAFSSIHVLIISQCKAFHTPYTQAICLFLVSGFFTVLLRPQ